MANSTIMHSRRVSKKLKTIDLAGRKLAYRDEGSGIPLLLIHAFPLSSMMWNFQIEEFKKDFRVIAPDLAGFGQSESLGEIASMDHYAADLVQLLTHLGIEKAVLMGLSLGGYIEFAFYRNYPSMVKALILCDTRSEADDAKAREGRYRLIGELKEKGSIAASDLMTPRLYAPQTYKTKPELVAQVAGLIEQNDPLGLIAATHALVARANSTPDLPNISVPCLVLVGKDDVITPPDAAQAMAKAIPDWQFAVIPQAGHLSNLENPRFFNQVVETFLKGLKGER